MPHRKLWFYVDFLEFGLAKEMQSYKEILPRTMPENKKKFLIQKEQKLSQLFHSLSLLQL